MKRLIIAALCLFAAGLTIALADTSSDDSLVTIALTPGMDYVIEAGKPTRVACDWTGESDLPDYPKCTIVSRRNCGSSHPYSVKMEYELADSRGSKMEFVPLRGRTLYKVCLSKDEALSVLGAARSAGNCR